MLATPALDIDPMALAQWTIRSATDEDIESVLSLWAIAYDPPWATDTAKALSALLAADDQALLVAASDDALLGSLIAAWDGWRANFYRLAVHPGHRREGIATALLREGERRMRRRGAARLTAIVADEDHAATSFWRAAGYSRQQARTRFIRSAEEHG